MISNTLHQKQQLAAAHMANGKRQRDIALEIDVTPQTICNWKKNPKFIALVNTKLFEKTEQINRLSVHGSEEALCELLGLLSSDSERIRISAATAILRFSDHLVGREAPVSISRLGPTTEAGIVREQRANKEREELGYSLTGSL